MDANNFVMSSYQFVNSLASCYPNSAPNPNNTPASSSSGQSDGYFPPSAYTPNLYPGTPHQAHYSNPQSYNPLASGPGNVNAASTGSGHQSNEMVDYTQLQPQKFLLNQQQQQSSLNPQSCKYAGDGTSAGTNVGNSSNNNSTTSPQDLSTASSNSSAGAGGGNGSRPDISPKLSPSSVVENVSRTMKSTSAAATVSGSNTNNNSSNISNRNPVNQVNLPLGSPEGDESDASDDDSGTEGGSSQGGGSGGKKSGGPPQIYPWMKRVHIGQSK